MLAVESSLNAGWGLCIFPASETIQVSSIGIQYMYVVILYRVRIIAIGAIVFCVTANNLYEYVYPAL